MHRLEPVVWTKGTILNAQHLQLQDRYLEDSLRFRLNATQFQPWGFTKLRIDDEALAAGIINLTQAAGIFPDGLLFDVPELDAGPAPKPIGSHFGPDDSRLDFCLAIPHYRERGINVAGLQRQVDARYRAEIAMVSDENTGRSEKPVTLARKNLRIIVEGESVEGMSTIPVGRILRTPAGLFELDSRCVPPLLDFHANDYLSAIARRLVEILSARSDALSGLRRQKNQSLADFTASDIASFWLLYTVNSALPIFQHLYAAPGIHPEMIYSEMLSLAGALTAFSMKLQPRNLPIYDHENLGVCFTELDEALRMLLTTVVPSNFVSLPLKLVQPSIYATSIDREDYFKNTRMYLAIQAETNQAEIIRRTPQLVKICSADYIEHLVQTALPGIPLRHVPAPPSSIPVKLNFNYFSLEQKGGPYEAVVRARNLAVYVPADLPNPQMELIILLPKAESGA
ncbi:type VI secretion system baseplate subunit TssK [Paludibaculum fermentans]|uniref:Type VI secretion system baseplate subunit TssK n=1 Tax=Paludibaculum fermentans TaxID=1473598 RepID=A0A7S7SLH0_PALFE|nr:type VI secretion system baseplate subunit TssK [Paludibaculum fermentans]QOY88431.1 type VI secretion system baseplate subunit TssK [Paludibaculum fermentans]